MNREKVKHNCLVATEALNANKVPRIDMSRTLGKNSLTERLVKHVQKFAISVAETSSKVQEPKTYNEKIHNLVNEIRWEKVIDVELWNLNFHKT